jgi:hypothetical protein
MVASGGGPAANAADAAALDTPEYTAEGRLKFPENYREWIFLTSGLDMTYSLFGADHSMFDNVFVQPEAYREFKRTGTWPEGTLLAKEPRGASGKGSINKGGKFQTESTMGLEVHTKDSKRFAGGWAFFVFGDKQPVAQIPTVADCYSCHGQHGAVDTTFVQFYPTLLAIAKQHGTFKADN